MSKAYQDMQTVPKTVWPYGYLYVDSTDSRPTGRQVKVERCEVHIRYSDQISTTLFFHVMEIRKKPPREYTVFLFTGEKGRRAIMMIDVSYYDHDSKHAQFEITVIDGRYSCLARLLAQFLHPIVVDLLICMKVPKDNQGRFLKLWYVGFTESRMTEIEKFYGGGSLRAMTMALQQMAD